LYKPFQESDVWRGGAGTRRTRSIGAYCRSASHNKWDNTADLPDLIEYPIGPTLAGGSQSRSAFMLGLLPWCGNASRALAYLRQLCLPVSSLTGRHALPPLPSSRPFGRSICLHRYSAAPTTFFSRPSNIERASSGCMTPFKPPQCWFRH